MSRASGRKPRRSGKRLSKKEQAEIKAMSDMGHSNYAIEKQTGISHNTIDKYLSDQAAYNDPKMVEKINQIKEKEVLDLTILNVKAKQRLHEIAPRANMIESIALMDRTFQQLRLLEGKSTQNIATLTKIVEEAHATITHVDQRTGHTTNSADVQDAEIIKPHAPIDIEVEASRGK